MLEISIANVDEFKNLETPWNALVHSMERPSVFCSWEWVHTWWKHFGQYYKEIIFLIYDNGELVGILPLGLRYMFPEDSLVPVRVLSFYGTYELHSDYTDLIYARKDAGDCLSIILAFLTTHFKDWDVLHFSHVSEDSHLMKFFRSSTSVPSEIQPVSMAPYISLKSKFDNNSEKYLQSLSRNKRHDIRRRRNALYNSAGCSYTESSPHQNGKGMKRLFELHALRASRKQIESSFHGNKLFRFHEEISEAFEKRGFLFLRCIEVNGIAVASLYGFLFSGRLFAYQSGHDPDWETKGVGSVLLFDAICEALDRGLVEFDFLRGGEAYKGTWTNEAKTLNDIWVYNTTPRSRLFRVARRARNTAKTLILKLIS